MLNLLRHLQQFLQSRALLPFDIEVFSAHVPVGGYLSVLWTEQLEVTDDGCRAEVEDGIHGFLQGSVTDLSCAEGIDSEGDRSSHTDGVRDLHLAFLRKACLHDVLGDPTSSIRGTAVDFARVFARECATTVTAVATVRIYDNFAPSESAVAWRTTDDEATRGVDVVDRVFREVATAHGLDDVFADILADLLMAHGIFVLGGDHDGLDCLRCAIISVLDRHLALTIRAKIAEAICLPHLRELARELVREADGEWHEFGRLIARVAEHEALVAGSLFLCLRFFSRDSHIDVCTLLTDTDEDSTRLVIEAELAIVVADLLNRLPCDLCHRDVRLRLDLSCDDHEPGRCQTLARDVGVGIVLQCVVEHSVTDLVAELIWVTFGNGFGGEEGGHNGRGERAGKKEKAEREVRAGKAGKAERYQRG